MFFSRYKSQTEKKLKEAFGSVKRDMELLRSQLESLKKENETLKYENALLEQKVSKENKSIQIDENMILKLLENNLREKIISENNEQALNQEVSVVNGEQTFDELQYENDTDAQELKDIDEINKIDKLISPSERLILFLLLSKPEGMTLDEIGKELNKDKKTIHTQITSMKQKSIPISSIPTKYNKMLYMLNEELSIKLEKLRNNLKIYNQ